MNHFFNRKTDSRGFSIVELVVAIAIIGVLISAIVVNLGTSRLKARNAQRISDLQKVQLAIEEYYDDNKVYPTCQGNNYCSSLVSAGIPDGSFGDFRYLDIRPNYITQIPLDPMNKTVGTITYNYCYVRGFRKNAADTSVVNTGLTTDYILVARLEDATYTGYGAPSGTYFNACNKNYRNVLLGN